jgi:hypothetical protein
MKKEIVKKMSYGDKVALLLSVGKHHSKHIYDILALSIDVYDGIEEDLKTNGFIEKDASERRYVLANKKDNKLYIVQVW